MTIQGCALDRHRTNVVTAADHGTAAAVDPLPTSGGRRAKGDHRLFDHYCGPPTSADVRRGSNWLGVRRAVVADEVAGALPATSWARRHPTEPRQPSWAAVGGRRDDASTSRQVHRRGARSTLDGPTIARDLRSQGFRVAAGIQPGRTAGSTTHLPPHSRPTPGH